ncbi:MAG TPA: DUF4013 domain-containing protein, partial [Thermoanaerobaculia bacterium]|nr:DUF4013 domain-containing protein [Thermoanaerobaculia bacterium]
LIGYVFLLGYLARLVRNVVAGLERPLPDWTELGEYFAEGLKLLAVGFLYMLPIVALIVAFGVPSAVLGGVWDERVGEALFSTVLCFTVPLGFLVMLVLPAALLRVITLRRFSAAFEFQQIYDFIRRNFVNYLLAIVTYLVANFAAQFGVILCCIGVIFTGFWSLVVTMYGFAQVCRLDSR